ncbi:hypothetical protein [uncultured Gimesia sp.]|uniref:LptA/OstA family protein n=1 Tax=uncultured Gimesia sp. TaxID=1678688 RepID=UPI0030D91591
MLTRLFVVLFCLLGIHDLCLAETLAPVRKHKLKNYAALSAKTKSFEFGPFKMQAEELNIRVTRRDQNIIRLKGDARLICGETCLSAETIEVSYKDEQDLRVFLTGNVHIENERDQLRMTAQRARLEMDKRFLELRSSERGHVSLIRTQNQKTTQIEASRILMKYKNMHMMLIHPIEEVKIVERSATAEDRVKVETDQPSPFDFFADIAVTDIKLFSEDWSVQAEKPNLHD